MKKLGITLGILILLFCNAGNSHALDALKKTVAVFDFENSVNTWGGWKIGRDFATQLTDSLVQSNKFTVLSRTELDAVLQEQNMANSYRFSQSNSAKTGKIVPAQILIKGKITEFEESQSGGGQGLNLRGFSLNMKTSTAHIAVILQLIDSSSGQIIDSKRVEGESSATSTSLGFSGGFDIGSSNFKKTPLGKAIQIALDRAVEYIAQKSDEIPWSGKVIMEKEGVVYLNSGTNIGIQEGDTFFIESMGEELIDPDTGITLGHENKRLGQIKVTEAQEKFAKATTIGDIGEIKKGDLVLEK